MNALHNHMGLNNFECRMIELIAQGLKTNEIAALMNENPHALETYRWRLLGKVGVKNACELVAWAYRNRVLLVEDEIDAPI